MVRGFPLTRRDLAALLTVVVVAVPGLAVAQQQSQPPEVDEVETEEPETETPAAEEPEAEVEDDEDARSAEAEVEDDQEGTTVDDGHGEVVSTLARCLPSGRELHGTGRTKGAIISQVAALGTFTTDDGETTEVTTPEDATELCKKVQSMADATTAPDTAKGRPDWAGPDDEPEDDEGEGTTDAEADEVDSSRGGPPPHAPARGHRGRG